MTTPVVIEREVDSRGIERVRRAEYAERSRIAHGPLGVEETAGLRLARMVAVAEMFRAGGSQREMVEASVLRVASKSETRKVTVIR